MTTHIEPIKQYLHIKHVIRAPQVILVSSPCVLAGAFLAGPSVNKNINLCNTDVCEKALLRRGHEGISADNTLKSVSKQFLLLDCKAKPRTKGMFVHRHRHYKGYSASVKTYYFWARCWCSESLSSHASSSLEECFCSQTPVLN